MELVLAFGEGLAMAHFTDAKIITLPGVEKREWIAKSISRRGGLCFAELDPTDPGLVRLLTGYANKFDKKVSKVVKELIELREVACRLAMPELPPLPRSKRCKQYAKTKKEHEVMIESRMHELVSLVLPSFTGEDGIEVQEVACEVPMSIRGKFVIPLKTDPIVWLYKRVKAADPTPRNKPLTAIHSPIKRRAYWHQSHKAYIACKQSAPMSDNSPSCDVTPEKKSSCSGLRRPPCFPCKCALLKPRRGHRRRLQLRLMRNVESCKQRGICIAIGYDQKRLEQGTKTDT